MQLWISRHFLKFKVFKWTLLNIVSRLSRMNARWKNFSLTPKKSAKVKSSDACCLCGVNFKISVGNFGDRTSIFRPVRAGVEKIRLADLLKIHLGVELDAQIGKSSCEHSRLTPILQDKKQTDDQNQNNLKFFWNRCYFGLSRKVMSGTFCHSSCQGSAMLWWTLLSLTPLSGVAVAGATNAVNTKQTEAVTVSLFFLHPHPHAFNPISPTHGHFVLSPVSLASWRDQDGGLSDSTIHIILRSHRKIGDCEQSVFYTKRSVELSKEWQLWNAWVKIDC